MAHAALWFAGATPGLVLLWQGLQDRLGANPVETLTHATGLWALRLLLASLAITPLRRWVGWNVLAPYRRTLGLLSFGYAVAHAAVFAFFDHGLDVPAMLEDVVERPYITAGTTAFVCLLPLALTSTRGWIRRLGRRWRRLHRLAYVAATAGVLHYLWLVKADIAAPKAYAVVLIGLLAARLDVGSRRL